MNKTILFSSKLLTFLCLIGLLLGSSHYSNNIYNNNISTNSAELPGKKKDAKLNPIVFDATVHCLHTQLQLFTDFTFCKAKFLDIRALPLKSISGNIVDNIKVILFTKIIPSQAP